MPPPPLYCRQLINSKLKEFQFKLHINDLLLIFSVWLGESEASNSECKFHIAFLAIPNPSDLEAVQLHRESMGMSEKCNLYSTGGGDWNV
jgi:hypothetical protein